MTNSNSDERSGRRHVTRWLLLAACGFAACAPDPRVCVPGDQVHCRCPVDQTWGYRTCNSTGTEFGGCDCIIGLSPERDASYQASMSGSGTGTMRDAGGD